MLALGAADGLLNMPTMGAERLSMTSGCFPRKAACFAQLLESPFRLNASKRKQTRVRGLLRPF